MLPPGFKLGTSELKDQWSTTEVKFLVDFEATNFYIKRDVGVCDHHTPLGEIAWKIP